MAAQKRIGKVSWIEAPAETGLTDAPFKEYADLIKSPPNGMTVALIDESDLHKWTITMDGPPGSPYAVCKTISKTFVTRKLSATSHPIKAAPGQSHPTILPSRLSPKYLLVRRNAQHLTILHKVFDYLRPSYHSTHLGNAPLPIWLSF